MLEEEGEKVREKITAPSTERRPTLYKRNSIWLLNVKEGDNNIIH